MLFSVVTLLPKIKIPLGLVCRLCTADSADDQGILCPSPVTLGVLAAIPGSTAAFPMSVVYSVLRM